MGVLVLLLPPLFRGGLNRVDDPTDSEHLDLKNWIASNSIAWQGSRQTSDDIKQFPKSYY